MSELKTVITMDTLMTELIDWNQETECLCQDCGVQAATVMVQPTMTSPGLDFWLDETDPYMSCLDCARRSGHQIVSSGLDLEAELS